MSQEDKASSAVLMLQASSASIIFDDSSARIVLNRIFDVVSLRHFDSRDVNFDSEGSSGGLCLVERLQIAAIKILNSVK